jgi:hypothetical protein
MSANTADHHFYSFCLRTSKDRDDVRPGRRKDASGRTDSVQTPLNLFLDPRDEDDNAATATAVVSLQPCQQHISASTRHWQAVFAASERSTVDRCDCAD